MPEGWQLCSVVTHASRDAHGRGCLVETQGILRQAMTADPLLDAVLEPSQIEALTEEMLSVNANFLPQFATSV